MIFRHLLLQWHVPAGNYMFKVNNKNTRTMCEICSKLKIKTPERRPWKFNVHVFSIIIFYCWDNFLSSFFVFFSVYSHYFIPFILRSCYDFHLFFTFTFEFYYKLVSAGISLCKQTSRNDLYTFVNRKTFQSTTCIGFFFFSICNLIILEIWGSRTNGRLIFF